MNTELTAKDVCSIIKACKCSGVTDIKIGEIEISFKKEASWPEASLYASLPKNNANNISQTEMTTEPSVAADEYNYQLAIDDPSAWERSQLEESDRG
jgi:hypothetical protein